MATFESSTHLLADPPALRARFDEDGYVYLPGAVDRDVVLETREAFVRVLDGHGWIRPGTDPLDAVAEGPACVEGEKPYFEVYDDIQRLEALHALPHHPSVHRCMEALLGDTVFPHPLGIARLVFPDNEPWTTPPHQDYPNNQGTADLYACWIPLGDCPVELGSLSILPGSHRRGLLPLEFSLGAGNRRARVDDRFADLEWLSGDFRAGDAIVFHSHTVHRALPNTTDRMRLSVDYRFQREGEPLTEGCLLPHFNRLSWEEIYAGWERDDLRYYWRDKRFDVVPWDPAFHQLTEEENVEAVRVWAEWRRDHPLRGFVRRSDQPLWGRKRTPQG